MPRGRSLQPPKESSRSMNDGCEFRSVVAAVGRAISGATWAQRQSICAAWTRRLSVLAACGLLLVAVMGCDPPAPPAAANPGPPPPPPPAAPAPKPVEPPPKPAPDRYEVAVGEIGKVLQRYPAVYAGVRDEASSAKAIEEIGRLTARLRELAAEISKLPYRAGQEKHTLALQADLMRMQTAQLSSPDMQRVMADSEMQITFLAAHQSFLLEGVGAIATAMLARQPSAPPDAAPAAPQQPAKNP